MRIAIHDYAGHPFQFGLSRRLAACGHEVRHFFFAGDSGPKGDARVAPDDPPTFSIEPIAISGNYSKGDLFDRRSKDRNYGKIASRKIMAFRPDVVLSGNTPTEAQDLILRAARRRQVPFVFWMQDFYSLAITRLLGGRWFGLGALIAAYYRRLERRQLRASAGVVLVSDTFQDGLAQLGIRQVPVAVIPNWGALSEIPVREKQNPWAKANAAASRFVVLYSGTLGLKHDPQILLRLADRLVDLTDLQIIVAAEGLGATALREALETQPRPNLLMKPLQSVADFPDMLGSADVLLAVLERDAHAFSVPSKVLSYLCAGRPVLLSAPAGNLASLTVAASNAGFVVEPGDVRALEERIRFLLDHPDQRQALGAAARRFAEQTFDLDTVAARFETVLEAAVAA